jgi:hypothetical protein
MPKLGFAVVAMVFGFFTAGFSTVALAQTLTAEETL